MAAWIILSSTPWAEALATVSPTSSSFSPVNAKKPFNVYYDSTNHWHRDNRFHYEIPERISACVHAVHELQNSRPDISVDLVDIAPLETTPPTIRSGTSVIDSKQCLPCSDQELKHARNILLQTHKKELVTSLESLCRNAKEQRIKDGKPALGHIGYIDGGDTFVTTETIDVCMRATAAWIRAVDYVVDVPSTFSANALANGPGMAMALTRPPGHHATYSVQNGFCLYNFASAAAIHAILHLGVTKVSILDWDVHYGQGVADIASRHKNSIRYVSIHQTPAFPYEGESARIQDNVNTLPMPPDTTWTCGYSDLFEKALKFCAERGEWEPDLVIVCAGYDALSNDPLASACLDASDYARMSHRLCQHLAESCINPPKLILGLEGGYHLGDGGASGNLPKAVVETIRALTEQTYI